MKRKATAVAETRAEELKRDLIQVGERRKFFNETKTVSFQLDIEVYKAMKSLVAQGEAPSMVYIVEKALRKELNI